ncbi:MAG TPA: hypothetical protein VF950_22480 [Planctomycetota bacterium]
MEETKPVTLTAAAAGAPVTQIPAATTVAPVVLPGAAPAVTPVPAPAVESDKK